MNDEKKVSIIVPIYKVERYLDRCIRSIVNQTYKNFELILVDDGSPDNCPQLCDEWEIKDERIRVIHKKNGGLSDARNAGLTIATGEYVCFVDSDDWISSIFIETLLNLALENDCDIAECNFLITSNNEITEEKKELVEICIHELNDAMEYHLNDIMYKQVVWNKLYKRKLITVQFEKGKYHEDVFWTYQIIANCNKLAHVELPLYYYFQRNDSIMGENYSIKRLDAIEAYERRCKFISDKFENLNYVSQKGFIGTCMYHSQLILESNIINNIEIIKNLNSKSKLIGEEWKKSKNISLKYKLWMNLYLCFPLFTCKLRNKLGIGR